MKGSEFERLIEKYRQGLLSGEEKQLMDEWFDAVGKNEVQPVRSEEERLDLKMRIMAARGFSHGSGVVTNKEVWGRRFLRVWQIAASILLVAAFSYAVWQFSFLSKKLSPAKQITSSSHSGAINKLLLADGTIVWLKNNSSLTYPDKFFGDQRRVTLRGEALFEVAKDAKHPFIIQCGDLTTTVLGTSFNIRATENDIEVVVLTGKVALTSLSDRQEIVVLVEEKAVYKKELNQLTKVKAAPDELLNSATGTEYDMSFKRTPMKDAILRMEAKFNVNVSVTDSSLNNCLITAILTDQSLEKTLKIIAAALNIQYEIEGSEITLKGKGCN